MGPARSLARDYARHRFTVLLAALLITIAGHGLVGVATPIANPLDWLLAISVVAVVFSAGRGRLRWFLGALAVGGITARLLQEVVEHPAPSVFSQSLLGLTCLLAVGLAVRRALTSGPVDVEHISAALDAYLLVGVAFGVGYWVMETLLPGSFTSASGARLTPPRTIYFSFVVQATLGFGDIVPISEPAQGLVAVQGVGGQMYLAVLVARLVSLYSAQESR